MAARSTDERLGMAPEALFVVGAIAQYAGAAIAIGLFDEVGPVGMAWLRGASAALIIVCWRRSWRQQWSSDVIGLLLAFGVFTVGMNISFYLAAERLPLGNAVAIEFLGPITVAAIGLRSARNLGALALAAGGVLLLAQVEIGGEPLGVLFALAAAALWAGHILLGARVARSSTPSDALGVALVLGSLTFLPVGLPAGWPAFSSAQLLSAAVVVGILSTAVPYLLDQVVFRQVDTRRFALLLAILPATATAVGWVALGQVPSVVETIGISAVIAAVALRERT